MGRFGAALLRAPEIYGRLTEDDATGWAVVDELSDRPGSGAGVADETGRAGGKEW